MLAHSAVLHSVVVPVLCNMEIHVNLQQATNRPLHLDTASLSNQVADFVSACPIVAEEAGPQRAALTLHKCVKRFEVDDGTPTLVGHDQKYLRYGQDIYFMITLFFCLMKRRAPWRRKGKHFTLFRLNLNCR